MSSNEVPVEAVEPADLPYARPELAQAPARRSPRVWPPLVLVGLFWAYFLVSERIEMPTFTRFLSQMGVLIGLTLAFIIWWLASRGLRLSQRLIVLGVAIVGGAGAVLLSHRSLGPITVMKGLPWVFTAWALCVAATRGSSTRTRFVGIVAVLLLAWGAWPLLRMEGLTGTGAPALHWRWSKTAEEAYLAQRGTSHHNWPRLSVSSRRPGRARPTLPGCASQSAGEHTVNCASVEP